MAAMPDASVDAVVTDPPYGLEFMGKEWDRLRPDVSGRDDLRGALKGERISGGSFGERIGIAYGTPHKNPRCRRCYKLKHDHEKGRCKCKAPDWDLRKAEYGYAMQWWHERWAIEALRVLKPGGHLLAFGGTRTYHRLACAIEDAGFEIRDCLAWLFGSGFPKSHNLVPFSIIATRQTFDGWGTALKPAHEPIVVARKPLAGTVAANVLEHGTGALNVDGCRIATEENRARFNHARDNGSSYVIQREDAYIDPGGDGRWPANVVLDEEAAAMLDEQAGELGLSTGTRQSVHGYGMQMPANGQQVGFGDSGGASRFFYVAKASRAERNAGLEGFEEADDFRTQGAGRSPVLRCPEHGASIPSGGTTYSCGCAKVWDGREGRPHPVKNNHPTVKPVALMRWLVRLVTPPGGRVLDPFAGSGTTGIACALEGFEFTGCEQDADYAKIAEARIAWWAEHGEEALRIVAEREKAEAERESVRESGQLELL